MLWDQPIYRQSENEDEQTCVVTCLQETPQMYLSAFDSQMSRGSLKTMYKIEGIL